jgi:hypothetical protein
MREKTIFTTKDTKNTKFRSRHILTPFVTFVLFVVKTFSSADVIVMKSYREFALGASTLR